MFSITCILVGIDPHNLSAALGKYNLDFKQLAHFTLYFLKKENAAELIQILNEMEKTEIVLVIGPGFSSTKFLFDALQFYGNYFNTGVILPKISKQSAVKVFNELRKPYLLNLFSIGSQVHLNENAIINDIETEIISLSLGQIKQNHALAEPIIRYSDFISVDINSLKISETGSKQLGYITGLFLEELSQLLYYAGRSEKTKILSLYGWEEEESQIIIDILALLSWYFSYGVNNRSTRKTISKSTAQLFTIEGLLDEKDLEFYKDSHDGKWWVKYPFGLGKKIEYLRLIPCSYQDYLDASEGYLSARLERYFQTLEKVQESF